MGAMHDNCKSQQNTKAKAWACSDSKGAVAVESAWIPEYVHVNMYCFDCFYFVFERPKPRRNHPLKWNAHSCTCTRIKTSSVLFSRIVWVSEKFAIVFIGIRSSGKDLDELYLCLRFFLLRHVMIPSSSWTPMERRGLDLLDMRNFCQLAHAQRFFHACTWILLPCCNGRFCGRRLRDQDRRWRLGPWREHLDPGEQKFGQRAQWGRRERKVIPKGRGPWTPFQSSSLKSQVRRDAGNKNWHTVLCRSVSLSSGGQQMESRKCSSYE